jgi:hypothetical protein
MGLFFQESHINLEVDQLEKWYSTFGDELTHGAKDVTVWLNKEFEGTLQEDTLEEREHGMETNCHEGIVDLTPLLYILQAHPELDEKFASYDISGMNHGGHWRLAWMSSRECYCAQNSEYPHREVRCRASHITDFSRIEKFWEVVVCNQAIRDAFKARVYCGLYYDVQNFARRAIGTRGSKRKNPDLTTVTGSVAMKYSVGYSGKLPTREEIFPGEKWE